MNEARPNELKKPKPLVALDFMHHFLSSLSLSSGILPAQNIKKKIMKISIEKKTVHLYAQHTDKIKASLSSKDYRV
jgi:hypothetical protein